MDNGAAFGKVIELNDAQKEVTIKLNELQPVSTVLLPRPYPSFLPYYFDHDNDASFDIRHVESLQFSIGPGLDEAGLKMVQKIGILSVKLE